MAGRGRGTGQAEAALHPRHLSNGNVALLVNMARRAGLPWDAILGAEVARAYKPLPAAYLCTADLLGLAPDRCMMVAARADLEAAARSAFAPPSSPAERARPAADDRSGVSIRSTWSRPTLATSPTAGLLTRRAGSG